MINREYIHVDYSVLLEDKQFRQYIDDKFGRPSVMESILDGGIPYGKMTMLVGQSKLGSIIDRYIEYLDFVKKENRNNKINDIINGVF